MFAKKNRRFTRRTAIVAAFSALVLGAAGSACIALADDASRGRAAATPAAADLEQAFWSCDYVGTTYGVQAAPIEFCAEVTQALRVQKFGGDLEQMLHWWRQNKSAAHAAVEAIQLTGGASR
jgi:hypothetical protein